MTIRIGWEIRAEEKSLPDDLEPVIPLGKGTRRPPAVSGRRDYEGTLYEVARFRSHGARHGGKYGLTEEAFWELFEAQGGCCPICTTKFVPGGVSMAIDHNHDTDVVRGILCMKCNYALGVFQDSPDRLRNGLAYLLSRGYYGTNTQENA